MSLRQEEIPDNQDECIAYLSRGRFPVSLLTSFFGTADSDAKILEFLFLGLGSLVNEFIVGPAALGHIGKVNNH